MNRKQAEPILPEEEKEQMWKTGVLGAHTPQPLLDTMVYMCGLYFGGQEHRNLKLRQLQLMEPSGGVPYI